MEVILLMLKLLFSKKDRFGDSRFRDLDLDLDFSLDSGELLDDNDLKLRTLFLSLSFLGYFFDFFDSFLEVFLDFFFSFFLF